MLEIHSLKNFLLELFFPEFCFGCQREGSYLCPDCKSILEISGFHQRYATENLSDLYFALDYKNLLIKKLIRSFKYEPFVKELSKTLSSLIIDYFQLLEKRPEFSNFVLIPVPLEKRKLKWRGFNQTEEIGKEIVKFLGIPILNNVLSKIKETPAQVELQSKERKENLEGAFGVENKNLIENKKILLVDDVYTTGSTMEECAKILKKGGVREVIGVVVARASPDDDVL